MAMKWYSTFPKSPRPEPHHQMVYCHIQDSCWVVGCLGDSYASVEMQSVYSAAPLSYSLRPNKIVGISCPPLYFKSWLLTGIEQRSLGLVRNPQLTHAGARLFLKWLLYAYYQVVHFQNSKSLENLLLFFEVLKEFLIVRRNFCQSVIDFAIK